MSDIHLGLPYCSTSGLVDHSISLAQDIGNLYLNSEFSDVVLVVGSQRFYAHRVVLAARSNYFRAMMYGGLQESHQTEVEIKDANLIAFKILLKYIYQGYVALHTEKEETVHEILALSHQYGFEELEAAVCDYLKETLCINNFCVIYDLSLLYCLNGLRTVCQDFLDKNAQIIVNHSSFKMLSPMALKSIISRDSFCAPEVDIFCGVWEWAKANNVVDKALLQEVISLIRLPLLSLLDLLNVVRPSQLLSPDDILDAIKAKNESRDMDLQYRGYLVAEENVATPAKGAVVLTGEMKNNLLDGNTVNYDMDRGFTRHSIDESPQHILVKLGKPCIINHLRLVLWDKDPRSYSYYIDVSMDQKDWVRVVDHTLYHCRSWQYLYFPARAVRYIKVVGTNNTVNRVFHIVALEAYYTKLQVVLHHGLIVPRSNVALVSRSSVVVEGVSRSRNNLLNGDVTNYDWDSGYTCHQLGSGSICVQLGQPYWLGSLRLLLWDCDERSYSYYIHSSVNGRDWEVVTDKTRECCRSWQIIQFTPRPVVYFKIVGVFNTANEVFHCVHFECPASTIECPITETLPSSATITSITTTTTITSPSPPTHGNAPDAATRGRRSRSRGSARAYVTHVGPVMENHRGPPDAVSDDDGDQKYEFDMMAESNRSPELDAPQQQAANAVAEAAGDEAAAAADGAGLDDRLAFSSAASNGCSDHSSNDLFFGSASDVAAKNGSLAPFEAQEVESVQSCASAYSGADQFSAGEGGSAVDYSTLGARPRRSLRTTDYPYSHSMPPYYQHSRGPLSSLHFFAQQCPAALSGASSNCQLPGSSSRSNSTAHSSPTHSEYSFTRSSNSPTRSEYSNLSSLQNNRSGGSVKLVNPVLDMRQGLGYCMGAGGLGAGGSEGGAAPSTLAEVEVGSAITSSSGSAVYPRPPSPLLLERHDHVDEKDDSEKD
ncbi:BTB/POZ domain-containing protein 9-like isoform X4 [Hyalella azteca]|uniref:BTB/POZ domain-containing protein 9-like isoform X3 n=1 Tax=Hyalella azteca TaxID=294128 RepID=A0A8B7NRC4_HYAAZ|nr:BTB/POZ domain-containing protein 9-like isoform X3 [Hyalella azteca]XP_018016303.1 BTB/POZ domain-containing protein 9-like isoform X4 [Hyalella azteca]